MRWKPPDDHPWRKRRKPIGTAEQEAQRNRWAAAKRAQRAEVLGAAVEILAPSAGRHEADRGATAQRRFRPIRMLAPSTRRRITYSWVARQLRAWEHRWSVLDQRVEDLLRRVQALELGAVRVANNDSSEQN